MAEGLSATEVGKEIAEHHEHTAHEQRDRLVAIFEAILLSVVALLAAWSGYSAAKWGTESSLSLAKASSTRSKASVAEIKATQIRTLDSVSFNAAETAYASGDAKLFRLAVKRLRPGYRPAFEAWLATHPLKNPNAPADPSVSAAVPNPAGGAGAGADREGRPLLRGGPVGRRHGRQVRAADGLPGGRAVPCRHRQPLPGPRGALRAGLRRRGAARRVGCAAPRPPRAAVLDVTGVAEQGAQSLPGVRATNAHAWPPLPHNISLFAREYEGEYESSPPRPVRCI